MKLISFDVGIKNLAYCIIDLSNSRIITPIEQSQYHILDWGVFNLNQPDVETMQNSKCQHSTTKGKCMKNAKFVVNKQQYCGVHLKKQTFIPTECQLPSLSKASKVDVLEHIHKVSNIIGLTHIETDAKKNKKDLVDLLQKYYVKSYNPVKTKTCGEASLVHIGVELRKVMCDLINIFSISSEDFVLIENQISPIASKMKSIQGMLTQFFIDHDNTNIVYMSSSLKLKLNFIDSKDNNSNTTYASRKKSGIENVEYLFSKKLLFSLKECPSSSESERNYSMWQDIFKQHKKKDDLADCLLQGIYWVSRKLY